MLPGKALRTRTHDAAILVTGGGSQLSEQFDFYFLAATAIRYEEGIMAFDNNNAAFKRAVIQAFMDRGSDDDSLLVIGVDSDKFAEPLDGHKAVLTPGEWNDLLNVHRRRIRIVTSGVSRGIWSDFRKDRREKNVRILDEIKMFRDHHIQVIDTMPPGVQP